VRGACCIGGCAVRSTYYRNWDYYSIVISCRRIFFRCRSSFLLFRLRSSLLSCALAGVEPMIATDLLSQSSIEQPQPTQLAINPSLRVGDTPCKLANKASWLTTRSSFTHNDIGAESQLEDLAAYSFIMLGPGCYLQKLGRVCLRIL